MHKQDNYLLTQANLEMRKKGKAITTIVLSVISILMLILQLIFKYFSQGKVSGGFTIFGIKIDAGVTGKAGGAGVSAEGKVTTGGVSGKIGAGLGLGAGVEISIDWSNFSLW